MKNKCEKYEALFTFRSEEELKAHIAECQDCQKEHEEMQKVSQLIQEAKPYYTARRKRLAKLKMACAFLMIMLSGTTLGIINLNTDISDTLKYGTALSSEDLGFPVDSYGLITVE